MIYTHLDKNAMLPKISVAIITYNEERNIQRCLESVQQIAEEIVIVDSYSTDQTENISKSFKVRFLKHKFEGHIQQKNIALQQCRNEWVLSLDADEALSDTLIESLLVWKNSQPSKNAYSFHRLTNYCGKWVHHCGWYPDEKIRLVRKGKAVWGGVNPHDKLIVDFPVGKLYGDILHYSYYTKDDHLKQIEYFGKIAAKEMYKMRKKKSPFVIYLKTIAQFFKSFFIKRGFLDGKTGLQISYLSAFATYRKYSLLRQLYYENNHTVKN